MEENKNLGFDVIEEDHVEETELSIEINEELSYGLEENEDLEKGDEENEQ